MISLHVDVLYPEWSQFTLGKNCWKIVGKLLENCWKTVGKLLENCWKIVGKLLENCWKIVGKLLENCWKIVGKLMENCWKIDGKLMENWWKIVQLWGDSACDVVDGSFRSHRNRKTTRYRWSSTIEPTELPASTSGQVDWALRWRGWAVGWGRGGAVKVTLSSSEPPRYRAGPRVPFFLLDSRTSKLLSLLVRQKLYWSSFF